MSWRQHHGGGSTMPVSSVDDIEGKLKFKPGMTGAEQKARAKELRRFAELRGLEKEAVRERKKEVAKQAAVAATQATNLGTPKVTAAAATDSERPICTYFVQGKCAKGARCKFKHIMPEDDAQSVTSQISTGERLIFDVVDQVSSDVWHQIFVLCAVADVASASRCCSALAAVASSPSLWLRLHTNTFGQEEMDEPIDEGQSSPIARLECCRSEAALRSWARFADELPAELPLPNTLSLAITGKVGVSVHEGRTVRLWEARTGRRLGMKALKHNPLALDAATVGHKQSAYADDGTRPVAAIGDDLGGLHVLRLDEELEGVAQGRPFVPRIIDSATPTHAMTSVLVLSWASSGGDAEAAHVNGGKDGSEIELEVETDGQDESDEETNDSDRQGGNGEGRGQAGGDAGVCVASAYRDGVVVMSSFAPQSVRLGHASATVSWHGSLFLDGAGALAYEPRGQGGINAATWPSGGLASLWTDRGSLPLVSLAHSSDDAESGSSGRRNVLYACWGGMACAVDIETGMPRWQSGRPAGDVSEILENLDVAEVEDAADTMQVPPPQLPLPTRSSARGSSGGVCSRCSPSIGARLASFSPGWNLLAVACRQTVTLWDDRCPPGRPVARTEMHAEMSNMSAQDGGSDDGGCVHLDRGGNEWSGHLLHLPPRRNSPIYLYDLRRLGRRGMHGRSCTGAVPSLPLVARIPAPSRAGHSFARGAFAADSLFGMLVGGGGTGKAACSYRWAFRSTDRHHGSKWDDVTAEDEEEDSLKSIQEQKKAVAKERAASKKKRLVTKGGGFKAKQGSSNRTG